MSLIRNSFLAEVSPVTLHEQSGGFKFKRNKISHNHALSMFIFSLQTIVCDYKLVSKMKSFIHQNKRPLALTLTWEQYQTSTDKNSGTIIYISHILTSYSHACTSRPIYFLKSKRWHLNYISPTWLQLFNEFKSGFHSAANNINNKQYHINIFWHIRHDY